MITCGKCHSDFDEAVAAGICPYCGELVYEKVQKTVPLFFEGDAEDEGGLETKSIFSRGKTEADSPADCVIPCVGGTVPGRIQKTKPLFEDDEGDNSRIKRVSSLPKDGQQFEDPRWLPVGTILNSRYRVEKVVGSGGFGITYQVWDTQNAVYKAVKEYFQQGVVNRAPGTTEVLITAPKRREEFLYGKERLLREAQIVAKFQSSSIVRVDDYFEENNTSYMVMEYLDTQNLEEYIFERRRVLDPEQVIKITVHLCDALEEIHQAGVIHRDIAPDNIFVTDDGTVKVIDFGSSRLPEEAASERMTAVKPGFAPPEQYDLDPGSDRQQAWTDVYALGATMYMCLTGQKPAEATDRKSDYDRGTDRLCYPHEINPRIPEFLSNAVMTAMAINIHERFQNVSELKAAILQEREVLPVEVVRRKKRIRRSVGIGASIALILVLALTGIWRYFERKNDVVLNEAVVSIWYSVSNETALANQKNATFETMQAELAASDRFSEITIELTAIKEDEYAARLAEAYESGQMPLIFESVDASAAYMSDAERMEDVLNLIEKESCYFLDEYSRQIENEVRIPMGFNVPVIYINTTLVPDYAAGFSVATMDDLMTLCGGEMAYKPMVLNESLRSSYEAMFPDFAAFGANMEGYAIEDFLHGNAVLYFSDTSDYYTVRNTLQSSFKMIPITTENVICRFCDYWSISACEGDEEMAAKEILAYFFSNNIQDQYYVQTNLPGLPLEKSAVEEYAWVTRSMEDFLDDLSKYSFEIQ